MRELDIENADGPAAEFWRSLSMTPSSMRSPTKFEDPRSNPFRRKHCGPMEARPAVRPIPAPQTAREMASTAAENINKCRCVILKMAAPMATL